MDHILIVREDSDYDSVNYFIREMSECFEEHEIRVSVLDAGDEESVRQIMEESRDVAYDMIFAINGMLLEKDSVLGQSLLKPETMYCTMLFEHPMWYDEKLKNEFSKIVVVCPDRLHVEYIEKHYPNIWHTVFLPHGGCQCVKQIPFEEKRMDISFFGTYIKPDRVMQRIQEADGTEAMLMERMADRLRKEDRQTIEAVLADVLQEVGYTSDDASVEQWLPKVKDVDAYIRAYYRDKVIRALGDGGLRVDVYGNGWDDFDGRAVRHHGARFSESLELMADSKVSLNIMPWFKAGSHDRICSAMLCGSLVVTDNSQYLEEAFGEEHFHRFALDDLDALVEDVHEILADVEYSQERILHARDFAMRNHTWENRAEELLGYLWQIEEKTCNSGKNVVI